MTKKLKIYSANEITFMFAGLSLDSGRGDDEFCSIAKAEDTFTYKSGVDGEGTRNTVVNTYYTVTLTMMRTSSGNALLSAIHTGDIEIPGGAGVAPMFIRDRQGLSLFTAAESWINKMPDDAYGKEAGTIAWPFGVHNPVHVIGGN